jgi:two-component system chemotaxis response regulator CheB
MNRHRPAVEPIFQLMIARYAGANCLGVVLTGMGNDGAAGMFVMKKAGDFNLIQDEASCLGFGMPKKRS